MSISSMASTSLMASNAVLWSQEYILSEKRQKTFFCYGDSTKEMAEKIGSEGRSPEKKGSRFPFLYYCHRQ